MKHMKKTIRFSLLILICFAIAGVLHFIFKPKDINLGGYYWELVKENTTVIKNSDGKAVVGPAIILLHAEYPLIYGYAKSYFTINLQKKEVCLFKKTELWTFVKYLEKYSIKLNQQKLVTFYDVFPGAQHYSQYKAKNLQKGLQDKLSK
jgi:hypothetical protein